MCSIEEAWAGQTFDNKQVISQGDIHNAYMSIPSNMLNRDNEFMVSNPKQPQPRTLSRGINSKYSREPRVPQTLRNTNNIDLNISSIMPNTNNYGGLEPLPSYMNLYNNSNKDNTHEQPHPVTTGDNFANIENSFNVSETLDNFMNNNNNKNNNNNNNLIYEDTEEDKLIINNKFNNMESNNMKNNNKSNFTNLNNDNIQIKKMLESIINKLNKIEEDIKHNNKRNIYDIILYIIISILLLFIVYSILSKLLK